MLELSGALVVDTAAGSYRFTGHGNQCMLSAPSESSALELIRVALWLRRSPRLMAGASRLAQEGLTGRVMWRGQRVMSLGADEPGKRRRLHLMRPFTIHPTAICRAMGRRTQER